MHAGSRMPRRVQRASIGGPRPTRAAVERRPATPDHSAGMLLQMQRTAGNAAVTEVLRLSPAPAGSSAEGSRGTTVPTMTEDPAHQCAPAAFGQARGNLGGLTPATVLALQRTAGNAAVNSLLHGCTPREGAGTSVAANLSPVPIQRLIGFEIETRIPLYSQKHATDPLANAEYDSIHANVGLGDSSEVGVDKEGTKSIIEFVSAPVDDTQKVSQFQATAAQWVNVLVGLRNGGNATPPVVPLRNQIAAAPKRAKYGYGLGDSKAEINRLAFQATHGLRLDKVPEYLKKTKYGQMPGGTRFAKKQAGAQETAPAARNLTPLLVNRLDPKTIIAKRADRQKALQEVNGYFSLLIHYLLLGGKAIPGYLKNQTMLFYKSELSAVRNQLITTNAYANALFQGVHIPGLINDLLGVSGRVGNQLVLPGSGVDCTTWLTSVMSGTGDQVFQAAKNDWGNPIAPGTVKGRQAVVLEHRDLLYELPPPNELTLANPGAVVKYLVAVFKANKKAQSL